MFEPGNATTRGRSGWAAAGAAFAAGLAWMFMLGMGIVSDCENDPLCTGSCQDDCYNTFYRHYAVAAAFVAVVGAMAVARFGRRAWMVVVLSTVVASVGLIIFR